MIIAKRCDCNKFQYEHERYGAECIDPNDRFIRILGHPRYAETRKHDERAIMRIANRRDDE